LDEDIQLNGHRWDKSNKVYKYKIEYDKERLKTSKMQVTFRTNVYKDIKVYDWKLISDVKDNSFEPFVDRITKSNQSYISQAHGVVVKEHY
jgi:hypothetical protein